MPHVRRLSDLAAARRRQCRWWWWLWPAPARTRLGPDRPVVVAAVVVVVVLVPNTVSGPCRLRGRRHQLGHVPSVVLHVNQGTNSDRLLDICLSPKVGLHPGKTV